MLRRYGIIDLDATCACVRATPQRWRRAPAPGTL